MTAKDFVSEAEFEKIRSAVSKSAFFEHRKAVKSGGNTFSVWLHSSVVPDHTAKLVWDGHNYLIHFDYDYKGKAVGYGGGGFCTDDYSIFKSWDSFKAWFNRVMSAKSVMRENGYEVEEYGQISMF